MRIWQRIKCFFGVHDWSISFHPVLKKKKDWLEFECIWCGKHEMHNVDDIPWGAV